jgi:capsular exopolysaccharide family
MEEINLRDLLSYFKKHLILFIVMVLFVVSAGTIYSVFLLKPEYKAQATVILSSDKSKNTVQSEINANKNLIDTYTEVVKSHRVLDRVKNEMQIDDTYEQLVKKVTVASLKDTEIISISVVDRDKNHSYSLANTIADTFTNEIGQIYNDKSVNVLDRAVEPQKPHNVDLVKQEAIYAAAGIVLATAVIFLMFYIDRTIKTTEQIEQLFKLPIYGKIRKLETEKQKQQRKKHAEKAAKLEAKLAAKLEKEQQKEAKKAEKLAAKLEKQEKVNNEELGVDYQDGEETGAEAAQAEHITKAEVKPVVEIKAVGRKIIAEEKALQEKLAAEVEADEAENDEFNEELLDEDSELVLRDNPKSKVSEDFRTIRTSLYFSLNKKDSNAVLITSSTPNEGKSFIASNLAVAFAKTKKKVLLIDCDMRLGRQHEIFGLSNKEGLSNLLAESKLGEYREYLQKTTVKNLSIITRGVVPPNPSELLDSAIMEELLEKVKQKFDYVILDGTPIDGLSDSLILAKKTDRLVLVSAANMTTIEDLQNSKKALESIEVKISGVVLNRTVDERRGDYYYKYYN